MMAERVFWYTLPLFVIVSGNFSPLRIGPMLPIYGLIAVYVLMHLAEVRRFFGRYGIVTIAGLSLVPALLLAAWLSVEQHGLKGEEFSGAVDPVVYALLSSARYALALLFMVVLRARAGGTAGLWSAGLRVCYWLIFGMLVAQAVLYHALGIETGYLFQVSTGVRFGGIIGEPQTVSAWLFCLFLVLFFHEEGGTRGWTGKQWVLLLSLVAALWLTQSTAWILALFVFLAFRARWWLVLGVALLVVAIGVTDAVREKVKADMFTVSERTVTIVAGNELFSEDARSVLVGYGIGMTPYLIGNTNTMATYPEYDLSALGRQTVMNPYLEILFEMGIVGAGVLGYLWWKVLRPGGIKQLVAIAPVFVGIFGISGGFVAGYFLITVPIMLYLTHSPDRHGNVEQCA